MEAHRGLSSPHDLIICCQIFGKCNPYSAFKTMAAAVVA